MPKTALERYQVLLQHQFKFTVEELVVNRQGLMTEGQKENLNNLKKTITLLFVFIWILGIILLCPLFIVFTTGFDIVFFLDIVVIVCAIGAFGMLLVEGLKINRAIQQDKLLGQVLSFTGPIWISKEDKYNRRKPPYLLHIGLHSYGVSLSPEHYDMLKKVEGEIWRVYYAPNMGTLLSLEVVELHPASIWREIE